MQPWTRRLALCASLLILALAGCQPVPTDSAARGEVLFSRCAYCHMQDGSGSRELGAPAIAGMEAWYAEEQLNDFRTGRRGKHAQDFEGMRMRPIAMTLRSTQDVADVAAFVAQMEPKKPSGTLGGGDAVAGKAKFAVCEQCHGPDGKGYDNTENAMGLTKQVPGLVGRDDWYLQKQIHKFKSKMRGTQAAPNTDAWQMANVWVNMLATEQDVVDVLAYIQTLDQ